MSFITRYNYLKSAFNREENCTVLNEYGTEIRNLKFSSDFSKNEFITRINLSVDAQITENLQFSYPVFIPQNKEKNDKAIILVHGLNERSWTKHLGWAQSLCESTGKSVILFPISYHMNRCPRQWTDPRAMSKPLEDRKSVYPDVQNSTVINLALSERLTSLPQRFFLSGFNYADDLIKLMKDIKTGNHPLFCANTQIDFFAYSIGVFLVQCLLAADPEELFRDSKYVFFAGGSLFCEMNGISRFIMDNKAFERIYQYYLQEMEDDIKGGGTYSDVFGQSNMGTAFRAMIRPDKFKKLREKVLDYFKPRILVIPLRDDHVMPLRGVLDVYGRKANVKIMHFNFPYIHENPFPVHIPDALTLVDRAFNNVFSSAGAFLS